MAASWPAPFGPRHRTESRLAALPVDGLSEDGERAVRGDTTQEHKKNRAPTRSELQIMGGRVGLFAEWADYIETLKEAPWKSND